MRKRIEDYLNFPRLRAKYRLASAKKRTQILNEVIDLTGIHRKSLIRMLNRNPKQKKQHRGLKPKYQYDKLLPILEAIWFASDRPYLNGCPIMKWKTVR